MRHDILTLQYLLQQDSFRNSCVLAGEEKLHQVIFNVHVPTIAMGHGKASSPLSHGSLVLSNASYYEIHSDHGDPATYLTSLQEKGVVGLCIQLADPQSLPALTIEAARLLQFPIIVVDEQLPFIDLLQCVHTMLLERQNHGLNALGDFSHKLRQATLKTADLREILHILEQHSSMQIMYYSLVGESFCIPNDKACANETLETFRGMIDQNPNSGRGRLRLVLPNGRIVLSHPLIGLGQVLSYLGLVLPSGSPQTMSEEYAGLLLEYTSKTAEHILVRKLFLEERTHEGHSRLIKDILFGEVAHGDQMLAQIGLPALSNGNYLFVSGIVILERPEHAEEHRSIKTLNQDVVMMLRSLLSTHGIYNLILLHNNVIHLLCIRETFANTESQWEKVKRSLRKVVDSLKKSNRLKPENGLLIHAGFGHRKDRLQDAAQSYQEALDVVSVTRTLNSSFMSAFYEDMGIYQIFKSIGNTDQLIKFVQYHLGSLLAYDKHNQVPLLATLDQYLSCMGAKQETAERLYIHRQTLYHRLEKLEELLGENFLVTERRLCLEVAIRAYDLVKSDHIFQ
jgi:purine catabolism regulator